mgnify:FL=1
MSDFIAPGFEDSLKIASGKHDIVALNFTDRHEKSIPDIGLVRIADPETGAERWIDTSSSVIRRRYEDSWILHKAEITGVFRRSGIDNAELVTGEDYVKPLLRLFEKR